MSKISAEEKNYLGKYNINKYDRPSVTTDIAVFAIRETGDGANFRKDPEESLCVLLLKRGNYPYKDCLGLAGGFMSADESAADTSLKEVKNQTGVKNAYIKSLGIYSKPGRDSRGWIISNGFYALIDADKYKAREDGWEAAWYKLNVKELSSKKTSSKNSSTVTTGYEMTFVSDEGDKFKAVVNQVRKFEGTHSSVTYKITDSGKLAFDYPEVIINSYLELKKEAEDYSKVIFELMPERFTLNSLQNVYEIIRGKALTTPNFRRKIMPFVSPTDYEMTGPGHRPAALFERNPDAFV